MNINHAVSTDSGSLVSKRGFGNALIYVLLIVAIVVGAQFVLSSAFGSSPFYVVVSGSMRPTLEVGDIVVVQNVPFNNIHLNDVIIYAAPLPAGGCRDLVVVHRVVGFSSDGGLITQGDNRGSNPTPDEPGEWPYVHADCVRGVVVLVVPYIGKISMFFPPPTNYILVAIILVFIFLSEFRRKGGSETDGGRQGELHSPGKALHRILMRKIIQLQMRTTKRSGRFRLVVCDKISQASEDGHPRRSRLRSRVA
jgi:signal peptidase